jgi:fatty acid kinase fatty acid binding subunit
VIAVVTDSSAQLPPGRAEAAGIAIVPLTVVVAGREHLEGVDLDADEFYARLATGAHVTTSLPAPGRFAAAYAGLLAQGADEILSLHAAASVSGTVAAARLGAEGRHVSVADTGQASFGVGICALEAAATLRAGGSAEEALRAVAELAPAIGNTFVVGAGARGRVAAPSAGAARPILSFVDGRTVVVAEAPHDRVVEVLAAAAAPCGGHVRAAVGASDRSTFAAAERLAATLRARPEVADVVRYRVGPSVGAHTGAGTFGLFWWPAATVRESA